MLTREQLLARAGEIPPKPVALEAWWDGDSTGWFVVLDAVYQDRVWFRSTYRAVNIGCLRGDDGDLRLFNGAVPPWPEARLAAEVGQELAGRLGVPFYFPSPDHPEEDCPRWPDRGRGVPCRRCGIPLLQPGACRWRGVCYQCLLTEEREKKEAQWTPEERAGPRCHICGHPAKATRCESWMCASCLERYEDYQCSRCGVSVRILNTKAHTDICSRCDIRARLDMVPAEHREAIRAAHASGGKGVALDVAMDLLGWRLHDALAAVREFSKQAERVAAPDRPRE
jgi:hypothetical protein